MKVYNLNTLGIAKQQKECSTTKWNTLFLFYYKNNNAT